MMIQTLNFSKKFLQADSSVPILCSYTNATDRIQIIQLTNSPDFHLERVVFPGQRMIFEAMPEAKLEIQFSERRSIFIPCHQLRVTERTKV